ncbi:MAG: hypothetical protein ABI338_00615, partial [Gemmatimonadaceae bacterium]
GWERRSTERTGLSATTLRLATLYGQTASLELRPRATGGAIAVILIPYTVTATAPGAWRAAAEDLSDESEVLAT